MEPAKQQQEPAKSSYEWELNKKDPSFKSIGDRTPIVDRKSEHVQDQEEVRNPVGIHGDLMKTFEHQQIPGVDDIYYNGRSNPGYKVVTSSAFNWDKPLVMAETYAAYRQFNARNAYKTAMDQYAMGVNLQIGNRPPDAGPQLDRFVGRMSYLLRHGKHVADVAVLYPIAALQAAYFFASPPGSNRPGSSPAFYWALEGG